MQFNNKVAIVTGGGSGIGEGYAKRLASEGAAVVLVDIDAENGQRVVADIVRAGYQADFFRADVSAPKDASALTAFAENKHGGVDFLVNNAAVFGQIEYVPLMEVNFEYYLKVQSVNMNSCLLMSRAIVPLMEKRGGGAIINQSSTAAWVRNGGFYGIFKLAVNGITTNLAMELGDRGIRVNAIAPGPTETPGLAKVSRSLIDGIIQNNAIKRIGTPGDMADACVFLLSEQSSWVTGQILCVDGGFWMRP